MRRGIAATLLFLAGPLHAQRAPLDSAARDTWADLLAVHDARRADTIIVDRALASPVAALRAAAARVVGMNRIATRYGVLRARLTTERDSAAARDAAFALGLVKDAGSCDALRQAMLTPMLAVVAATAVGRLGAGCDEFTRVLADARTPAARAALLRLAASWPQFPDSTVVHAFRTARTPIEREAALYALARARRTAGAPLADAASRASDPQLRELAARLMTATVQRLSDSVRIIGRLDTLAGDPAAHVRVVAVRSLATFGIAAREPVVRSWARERDANVRLTLAESLGAITADGDTLWATWWRADTTPLIRRTLLRGAWQAHAVPALERRVGTLDTTPDYRVRVAMIDGAASASAEANAGRIVPRLDDGDPRVRAAAVSALASTSMGARTRLGIGAKLTAALDDIDPAVRSAALTALETERDAGLDDAVLSAYERAAADTSSRARAAALDIIAAAWRRDSSRVSAEQRARLSTWPLPADALLRDRVRKVAPLAHWQQGRVSADASAEYRRIVREVVEPSLRGRAPSLVLETDRGVVRIVLAGVSAPMTADHFMRLARAGYFRNLPFHRVVPAFVAQGGDPTGSGNGGPGYAIRDELTRASYLRGAVGMALSGPDTGGSQFFLTLAPQPHLDGAYTVFGHVRNGESAMDRLTQGDLLRNISVLPQ